MSMQAESPPTPVELPKITKQQEQLVDAIIAGETDAKALESAGYKPKDAYRAMWRLKREPKIKQHLQHRRQELAKRNQINADRVTRELAAVAFADIKDYVDMSGEEGALRVRDVAELGEASRAVADVSLDERGRVRVKLHDKLNALRQLREHLGMVQPENDQPLNLNVTFRRSDDPAIDVTSTVRQLHDAKNVPSEKPPEGTPTPKDDPPR